MIAHFLFSTYFEKKKVFYHSIPQVTVTDYYGTPDLYKSYFINMRKHCFTLSNKLFCPHK